MSETNKTLKISDVCYPGLGLAKQDNHIYFIKNALPGDIIEAKLTKVKASFSEGHVAEFIEKSSIRQTSFCKYSSQCGGCQWAEVDYKNQLPWKQNFVKEAFERIGKLNTTSFNFDIAHDKALHYRNRIMLRCQVIKKTLHLGYFEAGTHEKVFVDSCKIAQEPLDDLIGVLSGQSLKEDTKPFCLYLQVLPDLWSKNKPHILATLHPSVSHDTLKEVCELLKSQKNVLWAGLDKEAFQTEPFLFEEHLNISFYTKPQVFQQVNLPLNQLVRSEILEFVKEHSIKKVLDLYCGSGNLSLAIAKNIPTSQVEGFELSGPSIDLAKFVVEKNNLSNASYKKLNVGKFLKDQKKNPNSKTEAYDLIMIDPPRAGCKEECEALAKMGAQYLIYISCNPTTLARDLAILKENYDIISVKLFDFFPNTFHVETKVILKLKAVAL